MMTVQETREFLKTEYGINSYEELCRAIDAMGKINIAPFVNPPRQNGESGKEKKRRNRKS